MLILVNLLKVAKIMDYSWEFCFNEMLARLFYNNCNCAFYNNWWINFTLHYYTVKNVENAGSFNINRDIVLLTLNENGLCQVFFSGQIIVAFLLKKVTVLFYFRKQNANGATFGYSITKQIWRQSQKFAIWRLRHNNLYLGALFKYSSDSFILVSLTLIKKTFEQKLFF